MRLTGAAAAPLPDPGPRWCSLEQTYAKGHSANRGGRRPAAVAHPRDRNDGMAGRGVLFALDDAEERQMLAIPDARARVAWVASTIEERWDRDWLHETDALWFPVHYCLHGSSGFPQPGLPPEARTIFGGTPLGVPQLYSIDYKDADLVRRIATALSRMRDDAIWARAGLVERKDYTGPRDDNLKVGVFDEIQALATFYAKAAEAGRCVIFTVDM